MAIEFWTGRETSLADAEEIDRKRKLAESQAALFFALLMGAMAMLGILLTATSEPDDHPAALAECANVQLARSRLACFDTLARDRLIPFKGDALIQSGSER